MLVAHEMLETPVTQQHGGQSGSTSPPCGYKSLKWLDRIEVIDHLDEGYWEERGYDVGASVGRSNVRGEPRRPEVTAPAAIHDRLVGDRIVRFDDGERVLHWVVALLVLVLATRRHPLL